MFFVVVFFFGGVCPSQIFQCYFVRLRFEDLKFGYVFRSHGHLFLICDGYTFQIVYFMHHKWQAIPNMSVDIFDMEQNGINTLPPLPSPTPYLPLPQHTYPYPHYPPLDPSLSLHL